MALEKSGFPPKPEPKIYTPKRSQVKPIKADCPNAEGSLATTYEMPKADNTGDRDDADDEEVEDGLFVRSVLPISSASSSSESQVANSFSNEIMENNGLRTLHTTDPPMTTSLAKRNVDKLVNHLTRGLSDLSEDPEESTRE